MHFVLGPSAFFPTFIFPGVQKLFPSEVYSAAVCAARVLRRRHASRQSVTEGGAGNIWGRLYFIFFPSLMASSSDTPPPSTEVDSASLESGSLTHLLDSS